MSQPVSFQSYISNQNRGLLQQCPHKGNIGCVLSTSPNCCACSDHRPNAPAYPVYVDGEGIRYQGTRWGLYCWKCKGKSSVSLFALPNTPLGEDEFRTCTHHSQSTDYWTAISVGQCSPNQTSTTSFVQPPQPASPSSRHTSSQEYSIGPEDQSQRITRLRTELQGVRTGIQRIVSGLQELGEYTVQGQDSLQPHTMAST